MTSSQFVLYHKTKSCTCFIHILQCSATDSPILAITRLLLTELSSNLGSTFLAAATGSWGWCAACLLSRGPGPGDNTADVWLVMELLGPIMGSIRPEISQFFGAVCIAWFYTADSSTREICENEKCLALVIVCKQGATELTGRQSVDNL